MLERLFLGLGVRLRARAFQREMGVSRSLRISRSIGVPQSGVDGILICSLLAFELRLVNGFLGGVLKVNLSISLCTHAPRDEEHTKLFLAIFLSKNNSTF